MSPIQIFFRHGLGCRWTFLLCAKYEAGRHRHHQTTMYDGCPGPTSQLTPISQGRRTLNEWSNCPPCQLKDDRVFIFTHKTIRSFNPLLGNASRLFYNKFVRHDNIKAWANIPSFGPFYPVAHGMPTTKSCLINLKISAIASRHVPPAIPNNMPGSNPLVRGNDPWIYHCNYGFLPGII